MKFTQKPNHSSRWSAELDSLDGERFVEAFMVIRSRELLKLFLSDLFTEKEVLEFSRRFMGVYWLFLGAPYSRIQEMTGLSPAIIARLNKKFRDKKGGFWRVMHDVYPNPSRSPGFAKTKFLMHR